MATIRAAKRNDLFTCEELLKSPEFEMAEGGYPDTDLLLNFLDENYFLVAEENGTVVGLICGESMKSKSALVWWFVVRKDMRGQGIGKKLLAAFEDNCREHDIEWVILYSSEDEATLNFYKKSNFNIGKSFVEINKKL